ncbi:hypothetical protein GCM10010361_67310 [Streptomyces olivaceiscleroticus]|uniref:Uncharacterized protein n=1 Tax=Streptomyces olivaceiscleroticus TaxID=68245 RepID=A0ABP3L7R5_9ACTN
MPTTTNNTDNVDDIPRALSFLGPGRAPARLPRPPTTRTVEASPFTHDGIPVRISAPARRIAA